MGGIHPHAAPNQNEENIFLEYSSQHKFINQFSPLSALSTMLYVEVATINGNDQLGAFRLTQQSLKWKSNKKG